jgi:aminoglycoside N3'-acetyltransferase
MSKFKKKYQHFVELFIDEFCKLGVENNRVIMLHVGLKDLVKYTNFTYRECTELILDALKSFSPKAILVPSFTYSFVKSGVFHNLFSKSELGRFSEEVRISFSRYRSQDPIFSVLDVNNWLSMQKFNENKAFGHETLWSILDREDCLIINIGLKHLISAHIHHIEAINHVPYRKNIVKFGVKYTENLEYQSVKYSFFARNLDEGYTLDWDTIEAILNKSGVLFKSKVIDINLSVLSTQSMCNTITPLLNKDKFILVKK